MLTVLTQKPAFPVIISLTELKTQLIDGTVLVTGGAGFIGSHTCKALAAHRFLPLRI
jgi:FlaA1/EpsC-like NDP-sugar epimerase